LNSTARACSGRTRRISSWPARHRLFPRLRERAGQRGKSLSGGEQQILAIACSLVSRPRLLLLDEVPLGLMPILVEQTFEPFLEPSADPALVTHENLVRLRVARRA
jgi:ABC-type branched-subunit amino acid transport system ATPase component